MSLVGIAAAVVSDVPSIDLLVVPVTKVSFTGLLSTEVALLSYFCSKFVYP